MVKISSVTALALLASFAIGCLSQSIPSPETLVYSPTAASQTLASAKEDWRAQWNRIVAEAKKEGKVVSYTGFKRETQIGITQAVRDKYGIEVEFLPGSASETVAKISAERNAGVYVPDIANVGAAGGVLLKGKGFLETLDNVLILPEVLDLGNWVGGRLPWLDKDHTSLAFMAGADQYLSINTELVKPAEVTSYRDVLNPRWKKKIIMHDPTVPSGSSHWFALMGPILGMDYMRALIEQEPVITRDRRKSPEDLARGKYSIGIGMDMTILDLKKAGAPVAIVDPKEGRLLNYGNGAVHMLKNAAHPNAARLFANWLLTKEGQTVWSKGQLDPSARLDVPTDHLFPDMVPQPGRKYIQDTEETLLQRDESIKLARQIFASLVR